MEATNAIRSMVLLFVLGAATLSAGCHEMNVNTTLNADGSGVRDMEVTVETDKDEDEIMTLDEYRRLMNVTDERGWSYSETTRKSKDSDKIKQYHRFKRSRRAGDIVELSDMSGDILIIGTNEEGRHEDVHFTNSIYVETGMSPKGGTVTYRETFSWTGMVEALLDYRLEGHRPALAKRYPTLKTAQLQEWLGFLKGTFMVAVDDGIFNLDAGERARRFHRSIERVAAYAMKMIRENDPGSDPSLIDQVVRDVFVQWEDLGQTAEEMDLMGVVLAIGLDLTVRVDVPGRVLDTNADRREVHSGAASTRQTLVWDIDPGAAAGRPIDIYVKSQVPNP